MNINHTPTLNLRHFHQRTNKQKIYQWHCNKSHKILSQKQLCHSLKQNYIQCITLYYK